MSIENIKSGMSDVVSLFDSKMKGSVSFLVDLKEDTRHNLIQ
jgi:hypothetical protein